jgi:hypothetical protein
MNAPIQSKDKQSPMESGVTTVTVTMDIAREAKVREFLRNYRARQERARSCNIQFD